MCFSENMSLGIGLTGLLSSIYLYSKNKYASIGIGYFSLMEIIQFFQYKVIDQCNNNYNKFMDEYSLCSFRCLLYGANCSSNKFVICKIYFLS